METETAWEASEKLIFIASPLYKEADAETTLPHGEFN